MFCTAFSTAWNGGWVNVKRYKSDESERKSDVVGTTVFGTDFLGNGSFSELERGLPLMLIILTPFYAHFSPRANTYQLKIRK